MTVGVLLFLTGVFIAPHLSSSKWVNTEVLRASQITDGIVETRTMFMAVWADDGTALTAYRVIVPSLHDAGMIEVRIGSMDNEPIQHSVSENGIIEVEPNQVVAGRDPSVMTTLIGLTVVYGSMLSPFPKSVMDLEKQLVLFTFPIEVATAYETVAVMTMIRLPKGLGLNEIISVNPAQLFSKTADGDIVLDFSSEEKKQFAKTVIAGDMALASAQVHFRYPINLPYLEYVKKTIEVSHIGSAISILESVNLVNGGAALQGEFNRIPYMHLKYSGAQNSPFPVSHTVTEVQAIAPLDAFNIHYRDVIGNISSSNARREPQFTLVQIRPRFPLLGGWKAEFDYSFNVPVDGRLVQQKSNGWLDKSYVLAVPIHHSFPRLFAKNLTVEISLPSGSRDVQMFVGNRRVLNSSIKIEKRMGWMDTYLFSEGGKTIVSLSLGPTYESGIKPVYVKYSLNVLEANRAPLLLILYVLTVFLGYILGRRVSLKISSRAEESITSERDADYDVCRQVEDRFVELVRANAVFVEGVMEVLSSGGNAKENIPSSGTVLQSLLEAHTTEYRRISDEIASLCDQFVIERNRLSRTVRIASNLRNQHELVQKIVQQAGSATDPTPLIVKLVDLENALEALVGRVLVAADTPTEGLSSGNTSGHVSPSGDKKVGTMMHAGSSGMEKKQAPKKRHTGK